MKQNIDVKILAAIITSLATVTVFLITRIIDSVSKYREKKRIERMHLMSIKSELRINLNICETMLDHPKDLRTLGFRFVDDIWRASDKSVIYLRGVPCERILDIYSKIQHYHLLIERRNAIKAQGNYPNADNVIQIERGEMFKVVDGLKEELKQTLKEFP